jgi:thioredoxin reductase (NADPH)
MEATSKLTTSTIANEIWDVIIVGAGPAGMAAALYSRRARLHTLLLDRIPDGGGQLLTTDLIEDYPGVATTTGHQLAAEFRTQVELLGVDITWADVTAVGIRGEHRVVITEDGAEHMGRAVIVTTGGSPRKLGAAGEADFAARGVSYCAICDGPLFKGRTVVVVGGGDSAIEEAAFLARYADKVYVVHRRGSWRAQKLLQERALGNPKIVPIWNSTVEEIGGGQTVEWVQLRDARTGETSRVETGGVFIYVGFNPSSDILGAECARDEHGFVLTDGTMRTTVPGIYAAGDVRSPYVRQISNAVGDATIAAVAVARYVEGLSAAQRIDEQAA